MTPELRFRHVQGQRNGCPASGRAVDERFTAVQPRNALYDGKTQAGAAGIAGPRRIDAVKAVEYTRDMAVRNTNSRVTDAQDDLVCDYLRLNRYPSAPRCEPQRVFDQVADGALQERAVQLGVETVRHPESELNATLGR